MKNMDRWLGDGGMPLMGSLGVSFVRYGVDDGGHGWSEADWHATALATNPHGLVQGGAQSAVLDAAMNFALNAGMPGRDRTRVTLEMKTEWMRPARGEEQLLVRGQAVHVTRQVGWAEGRVLDSTGDLLSRATGTFLLHREH